ncbi:MAG TPA: pseudouridine synthase [Luteolibacter sp.]|nr:pseudouridine synthase [Luteolibacter sp.]
MHLLRHISNLGYGSRKEVERMIRQGAVTDDQGVVLKEGDRRPHESIRIHGEELDPPFPLTLMLHKPDGYTCSMEDPGSIIYDLLPERFAHRKPQLNPIGRLDKDTTGLLLLTDDGKLLHKVIHPKSGCRKVYHASLDRPLQGHEAELFASGTLLLNGETKPLLPATLEVLGPKDALVSLHEGRYHQVRRMFAAAGNHVSTLKRISIGGLKLPDDLEEGDWRIVGEAELDLLFGN